ncbi:hypothetical protein QBC40DRAFT_271626 [Triangularia verruculosa]|uniref:DNA mismatch repair protein HSM3 N-terminal domain-containing protein n=1 Tax=Triangularia verruculosa TaxID=2587418 RepID=A0AAN6XR08_9PEZI|nr:hypothetical protein QBC40DRAFT_271626 [Triangularia verruculosa]
MDNVPISGLDELHSHLDDLIQDPGLALIPKLFDDVELQLTDSNIPPLLPSLLPKLTQILQQYNDDPAVIVSLTIKLLRPISFAQVLQLASEDSLTQALNSPAPAAQILGLTILHKAASSHHDVTALSGMPTLVTTLLTTWLSSPKVEVGQKATKVLGDLLDIDCARPVPTPPPRLSSGAQPSHYELVIRRTAGYGKLWDLIFHTKNTYHHLLSLLTGRHPSTANNPSQLSLAQGRVLRILPRLAALDITAIAHSEIPALTPAHLTNGHLSSDEDSDNETTAPPPAQTQNSGTNPPQEGEGLLQYAALRMVDKGDMLMHLNLVDFFEAFVSLMRITEWSEPKEQVIKRMLAEAVPGDEMLKNALDSLPDRTVEEEAAGLRMWMRAIMPATSWIIPER